MRSLGVPQTIVEYDEARAELESVLSSVLRPKSNMAQLLRYVCEKCFEGLDHELKEYSIAVEVFGRPAEFDSSRDSIVRVEAHRLRTRLNRYYSEEGNRHAVRIVIAPGSYVPHFVRLSVAQPSEPGPAEQAAAPSLSEPFPAAASQDLAHLPKSEPAHPQVTAPNAPERERWFRSRWVAISIATSLLLLAGVATWVSVRNRIAAVSAGASVQHLQPLSADTDGVVLQMLCGLRSPSYVDARGQTWVGDRYFDGGDPEGIAPKPLAFADDPILYYRRRRARTGSFAYNIPLEPGSYELRLYFADAFFGEDNPDGGGEGSRIFDVIANGAPLLKNFDVISDAGGSNTADVKVFRNIRPAADGRLHLQFRSLRNIGFVNAIQILKAQPDGIRPQRFVTGFHSYLDRSGHTWEADRFYRGGVRVNDAAPAESTPDAELWRNERFGNFVYSIPVATGSSYSVTMRFRENSPPASLPNADSANIFDVYLNGRLLLDHLKVAYEKVAAPGEIRTFTHLHPNAQGKLIFSFVPVQNYALLNSIEVLDENVRQQP